MKVLISLSAVFLFLLSIYSTAQNKITYFDESSPSIQNPGLNNEIVKILNELQLGYSKHKKIIDAIDDAKRTLESYDLPAHKFFNIIQNQLKTAIPEGNSIIKSVNNEYLFSLKKKLRTAVLKFKNSTDHLIPTSIIRLESSSPEFKGKPWYVASFVYSDESSGTTGGLGMPHLALFRLPEFVDEPGMSFPPDFFINNKIFSKIEKKFMFRPHSACFMSEVFNHDRCDCAQQLKTAMQRVEDNGFGLILYLQQEARGAGLTDKMQFYTLQSGRNTEGDWLGLGFYDANQAMTEFGFDPDKRHYNFTIKILKGLGITNDIPIYMLSHNPLKAKPFIANGFKVNHIYESVRLNSIEALCETIKLKIIDQGHFIAFDQIENLLIQQTDLLKQGEKIDQRLYNTLIDLKNHLQNKLEVNHICSELLNLMSEIDHLLISKS